MNQREIEREYVKQRESEIERESVCVKQRER